jgi:nicotinate-nucleotide--dimethylbenzimidazole phosphoribosyltransferase
MGLPDNMEPLGIFLWEKLLIMIINPCCNNWIGNKNKKFHWEITVLHESKWRKYFLILKGDRFCCFLQMYYNIKSIKNQTNRFIRNFRSGRQQIGMVFQTLEPKIIKPNLVVSLLITELQITELVPIRKM